MMGVDCDLAWGGVDVGVDIVEGPLRMVMLM
jgi:hypothetical protein